MTCKMKSIDNTIIMGANTETVTFDVGGHIFKIKRSLLEMYPSSILYKSMNDERDQWVDEDSDFDSLQKSIVKHIFIDRDGYRFSYVLDYMRDDGKVILPVSISKEAFINELTHYGFEVINTDSISVSDTLPKSDGLPSSVGAKTESSAYNAVQELQKLEINYTNKMKDLEMQKDCLLLAHECYCQYFAKGNLRIEINQYGDRSGNVRGRGFDGKAAFGFDKSPTTNTIKEIPTTPVPKDIYGIATAMASCHTRVNDKATQTFQGYLKEYGLQLKSISEMSATNSSSASPCVCIELTGIDGQSKLE
jgi:BTB/POZ domain